MTRWRFGVVAAALLVLTATNPRAAEVRLKPYLLAELAPCTSETFDAMVTSVREDLLAAGFEIAGEVDPFDGRHVFVITNDAMKKNAAASPTGGFGVAQRVAVTRIASQAQISATNPVWMANVYQLKSDLADVAASLKTALGSREEFGSRDGRTAKQLRSYHYMMFMPHFDDQVVVAEYASHAEAIAKVEAGLSKAANARKVARIDVPGTEETLFSVAITGGDGADEAVMAVTDRAALKHTAYMPYELLVSGNKALMLHGKFRIAESFPDLTMGTFMKISGAPDGIENVLREAVK